MRANYLREFETINIDNLNGDKYRTGKTTPDGRSDPSAFSTPQNSEGIQVGTSIVTLLRTQSHDSIARLEYRDIWGTEKLSQLDSESRKLLVVDYGEIEIEPRLGNPFREVIYTEQYLTWHKLPDFFDVSFAGVKTSRDPLVIDIDRENLEARMRAYLDPSVSEAEMEKLVGAKLPSTKRFDAKAVRADLQQRSIQRFQGYVGDATKRELQQYSFRPWQIRRYTYRPFDLRWIYWEPETKLLDEKRTEALPEVFNGNRFLEARQQESGTVFCRGSITSSLPDNFGNGLSTFFPFNRSVWGLDGGREFGQVHIPNIGIGWEYLYRVYPREFIDDGDGHTHLHLHVLATLHTPRYRHENSGALLLDWPRIPLPATADLLTHSATLGRRLAELLDPESSIELVAEWSFLARLILPAELPEGTPDRDQRNVARLALTAGWGGAGQGATVMPRRGDARERDWTETELTRLTTLAANQSLTLDDAFTLLGPRCVDIYLNDDALWSAVPTKVWEYTLGGYQVLKKWLSYRELPLLGRPLHEDEAKYFAQVVRRITAILLMGPALDASYAAILPTATGLPTV